jgi:hypothetical protein
MRIILLSLFIALCSCSNEQGIEINNFRSGEIRTVDSERVIYREGKVFDYIENGICYVAKRKEPCINFGFAFDYKTIDKDITLQCETIISRDVVLTNNETGNEKRARTFDFELTLSGNYGHKLYIQSYYKMGSKRKGRTDYQTNCKYNGSNLFKTEISIIE